ncbi:MAG: anti-sigma factor [Candidatus Dormibacteraeota bacterium]|uniref:Regulator of SigK n=1 Tax=Candidatus Dormiibacter inghamiae TaxID=3127013 RepID=A0A934K6B3_9BACT|nr:anti-sigma factor [Candidatus Dormibacteraeota bacterium]MBJ7605109.1 anti-sigma factor [Candidatus Dormibacteraeota bacterium]
MTHPDLTDYLLGNASDNGLEGTRRHVDGCESCTGELAGLRKLPGLVAAATPPVTPPARLEGLVLQAVRREGALGRRRWLRWPRRSPAWAPAWAGAVAVLLLAVGALTVSSISHSRAPGGSGTAQPPTAQTQRLVATDGSAASGAARIEDGPSGKVVALTVEGLPANPPGQLYVCWLVDQGDASEQQNRLAVGTFSVSGPGPVTMRWTTGADTAHYRLEVTLERAEGNPQHSGPAVLRAK